MRRSPPPCVLTIAGSDSGGGAGVQADARTIHARGGFACMAITALTAQNTRGVQSWHAEPADIIAEQIAAVLGSPVAASASEPTSRRRGRSAGATSGALPIRAIKTGLLPGATAVRAVARALNPYAGLPLVVDPVIGSTSGTRFLDAAGLRALTRELLPLATLVTPNWPEAEALSGERIGSFADAERVARHLAAVSHCAVLLKGGHAPGDLCRDFLALPNGRLRVFESRRISTANSHGTGCVLSAAIATALARGESLERAVTESRRFLQASLRAGRRTDWSGAGPAFAG